MTHRRHFRQIMRGAPSDWTPNYELGLWGQTTERWLREGMPRDQAYLGDFFEGDPLFRLDRRAFARLNTGMIPGFTQEVLAEDARTVTMRHANGVVTRALKEGMAFGTRWCMDEYISFPVTDRATWADVKRRYDPAAPVRYPMWWDEHARLWRTRDYPVCLLANASYGLYSQLRSWVGTEKLSLMLYDDPALIEEMVEFWTDFLLALIERAVTDVEFDYFNFFEDLAGKGGPLVGPQQFRRFFLPAYKRIIERLNRAGIHSIWVDSDGDPEVLIPLWLEAGVNCFWPLEQASGMDPQRLRRRFGTDLVLCGGIDKRELAKGRAAIDRELHAKIPPLLEAGGYIPHVDHTVQPDVSYDDFQYYLDVKLRLLGRG